MGVAGRGGASDSRSLMTGSDSSASTTAQPGSRLGALLNAVRKRGGWAITDQAIVSIGNFTRNIALAHALSAEVFGAFGMLLSAFLFLSSLHAGGIIYPIQVKGAVLDDSRVPAFTTMCMLFTVIVAIPLLLAMGISSAWMLDSADLEPGQVSTVWTAVLSSIALGAFLMQELFRRTLMARLRFGAAVPGDAIAYLGQVGAIWAAGWMGWLTGPMALPRAMAVMAIASAIGAVIQALQVGLAPFRREDVKEYAGEFWRLGKWLLAANLTTLVTDIGYNWMLGLRHSTELAGFYRVIGDLNKVVNPVVFTLVGLIVPVVARTRAESGTLVAKRVGLKYVAVGAVPVMMYMLVLVAIPELLLRAIYPSAFEGLGNGIRIFAMTNIIGFLATMCLAILNGLGRPHVQFLSALTNTLATLLIGLPLTWYYDLWGALWGGLAATVALTIVAVGLFLRAK